MEGTWYWVGFNVFVIIMLLLDLGVFHKKDSVPSLKEAVLWTLFWIALALTFNVGVYFQLGETRAFEFFTAYVLEKSLSIDNLFVFIMIFGFFKIPAKYQHKVLFWGIFGAIIMRAIFIFSGIALINQFAWIMYVFGAFLIYTGVKMFIKKEEKEDDFNPNNNVFIREFRKLFPVKDDNTSGNFFIKENGKKFATTFFIALLFIELSDVVFAVDSIPAVLSVSKDVFIVFTSNIFAILGLRSLYFALNHVMGYFYYLKYALAGILSFIGFKMCFNEFCKEMGYSMYISNFVSLGIILGLITISIIASVWLQKKNSKKI